MWGHWPLIAAGVAMWAPLVVAAWRKLNSDDDRPGCPTCGHEAGLDGPHCAEQDDHNGWASDLCRCQHDYHRDYESVSAA